MSSGAELILASGSPRRRDLLSEAGYDFRIVVPGIEENEDTSQPIRLLTSSNAAAKADAVARENPDAVVLAADTLVLLGERVFSKPLDRAEASAMLADLSGRMHEVFTAVAIRCLGRGELVDFTVTTEVYFRDLSKEAQAEYHALIDPMDKAGAYAAQEHGDKVIDHIAGSMTNVIGLPMDEVAAVLRDRFGITPSR